MTVAGEPITLENRAINVSRRENGEWRLVHHHADRDDEFAEMVANTGA